MYIKAEKKMYTYFQNKVKFYSWCLLADSTNICLNLETPLALTTSYQN